MKFLFLCTGNSCRSILSEVLFNSRAPHDWKAYSVNRTGFVGDFFI